MRMAGVGGLALAVLIFVSGCATLSGRPFGQYVDDKTISAKVKLKLASRLHPGTLTRVHVDTYEGVVYLSGVADSEEMKARVERIVGHVDDVQQVVSNLSIKQPGAAQGASADAQGATGASDYVAASPAVIGTSALLETLSGVNEQLRGILRYQADGGVGGPYTGYDSNGRLVATVYLVPMRGLAQKGADDFGSGGRRIDHVSIYPIDVQPPDVPEARYAIVLWHVSPAEAAALR